MTVTTRLLTTAILTLTVLGGEAFAQGQSQGRGSGQSGKPVTATATVTASAVFRDSDRATFYNYFTTHKIAPQSLPPGVAKNVARGKPLPPGIAKRAVPADLLVLGPKVDKETSFAIVGEVVVALKGGVVIDVLAGVFK